MTELPSLSLLRELTDQHVVGALAEAGRLTRAEIAAQTGLSKPTVSESVRRLMAAGVVREAGRVTPAHGAVAGRGRAGINVELDPGIGCALAIDAGPGGVCVRAVGVSGRVVRTAHRPVRAPIAADALTDLIGEASREAADADRVRAVVIAVADAVDRHTGRLVHLDDTPFVHGTADLRAGLAGLPGFETATVEIDNDANWAAAAERSHGASRDVDDVAYLYLGDGLGLGLVLDGRVIRGRSGLAGEIGYLPTSLADPGAGSHLLPARFRALGLARGSGTAIDSQAVRALLDTDPGSEIAQRIVAFTTGVVATLSALVEPGLVVLAGPWGSHPLLVDEVARAATGFAIPTTVTAATVADGPLTGATDRATDLLRTTLTGTAAGSD